jgi:hypothetical protein
MSDQSHREFMRDLNMHRDKIWAEIREQVKGKSNEQLTHTERYLVRREAWRRIEQATGTGFGPGWPEHTPSPSGGHA